MTGASSGSRRSIAESLVTACRHAGATHAFGVPGGGSNLDVVGEVVGQGMRFVLTHTETAAAVMAGVTAQMTGAPALAIATRGPGLASAVNGVAQALLDHQPMVLVTDCVAASERSRISHQRIDQQAALRTVSKGSVVLDGRRPSAPAQVVGLALGGRPGPVHVDIDPSANGADTDVPADPTIAPPPLGAELDRLHELVGAARRPVLIVGSGAVVCGPAPRNRITSALAELGAATNIPMLCTYQARGMVADSATWCAGVATGATIEQPLLDEADLVIGVGLDPVELIPTAWPAGLGVVLIGTWAVDDSAFFGTDLRAEVVMNPSALADLLFGLTSRLDTAWPVAHGQLHRERAEAELRAAVPATPSSLTPQQVVDLTAAAAPPGCLATVDAGAHMLVAVPLWPTQEPCSLLISSGLATMGYALPAAIAAALVQPGRRVVCFTGDGGLGMVLGELETLARLESNVTVVVLDDASLSLIAAKQAPTGQGGSAATEYRVIDFAGVARACGVPGIRVSSTEGYRAALDEAFSTDGPMLIDAVVDPTAYGRVLDAVRGPRPAAGAR
jgi:acetolactate synthase I/II/III large subunit